MTQPVTSRVRRMSARSQLLSVIGKTAAESPNVGVMAGDADAFIGVAGSGFESTPSSDKITARSTRFCSSRTLPGQEYDEKAAIVSGGIWRMYLLVRRPTILTKCPTKAGTYCP